MSWNVTALWVTSSLQYIHQHFDILGTLYGIIFRMVSFGVWREISKLYLLFPCPGSEPCSETDGDQSVSIVTVGTWLSSEGQTGLLLVPPQCLFAVLTWGQPTEWGLGLQGINTLSGSRPHVDQGRKGRKSSKFPVLMTLILPKWELGTRGSHSLS